MVLDRISGDGLLDAVILRPPHKRGMVVTLNFDEDPVGPSTGPGYSVWWQRLDSRVRGAEGQRVGLLHDRKRERLLNQLTYLAPANLSRDESHPRECAFHGGGELIVG